MGVVGCDFDFFIYVGAEVGRFQGSFTLRDAVVLSGLLCLTSNLFCTISLWGVSCGLFFLEDMCQFPDCL